MNLDFHQLLNNFNSNNINERNSSFYINPSLSLGYKFNDNNKISLRFQNNLTNTRLINVFENFVLTNYRGFNKGLGNFDQVNASSWSLNYALGKWTNKFLPILVLCISKTMIFLYKFYSYTELFSNQHNCCERPRNVHAKWNNRSLF